MFIEVLHYDKMSNSYEKVAEVNTDFIHGIETVEQALEYAYRWTNNIDGSWSIKDEVFIDGFNNTDFNPYITVIKPLITYNGRQYGHRSSDVGDIFVVDGARYRCDNIGFSNLEKREYA